MATNQQTASSARCQYDEGFICSEGTRCLYKHVIHRKNPRLNAERALAVVELMIADNMNIRRYVDSLTKDVQILQNNLECLIRELPRFPEPEVENLCLRFSRSVNITPDQSTGRRYKRSGSAPPVPFTRKSRRDQAKPPKPKRSGSVASTRPKPRKAQKEQEE